MYSNSSYYVIIVLWWLTLMEEGINVLYYGERAYFNEEGCTLIKKGVLWWRRVYFDGEGCISMEKGIHYWRTAYFESLRTAMTGTLSYCSAALILTMDTTRSLDKWTPENKKLPLISLTQIKFSTKIKKNYHLFHAHIIKFTIQKS